MHRPYLLAARRPAVLRAALRSPLEQRALRVNDPAVRAMTDFLSDPPLTVAEDCTLSAALDEMFRSGVRAFLVARELTVVGLVTAEDMHHTAAQCVAECMTPASQMPAIDWQTVLASRVTDLLEIFEGARVEHLVVLESESASRARVRGLVHRSRVERRLHPRDDTF
jgi:CBS domain-containing protein